ncbi:MAG: DNA polymerase III subunit delta [Deltaproteobacteria bacterium]|nr:DNA polymerase III subunit delta [Deltaproteobacteria bacterium]MBM4324676.1 DNA polymerase III subunit delta [Deltaproteobacteria bacterium]MBM4347392.1 DNA polymerase III subunit delta [Deltaproteobacteria bacterium]
MTKPNSPTSNICFLYGPEEYLIEEEVRRLLDQTLSHKERGLNLHLFNGEEHSGQEIVQTAQTLPMFSQYRFVLIRRAEQFDDENVEALLLYIRNPSPSTCLVMCAQTIGPWKTYKKEMEKVGKVIEYPRFKGRGLVSWVKKRMEEKGRAISEEGANYLIEVMGDHLQDLDNGLEKAFLSVGDRKKVELSDVEGIISETKVSTVFDLTDAIGQQNLEKALSILEKTLELKTIPFKKEEPTPKRKDDPVPLLVGMMSRHYWNIWRAKELASKRKNLEEMAGELRMPVWNVKKFIEQGRSFSVTSLEEGIRKCHETDLAIKTGRGPKNLLMEKLVIDLCRPRGIR